MRPRLLGRRQRAQLPRPPQHGTPAEVVQISSRSPYRPSLADELSRIAADLAKAGTRAGEMDDDLGFEVIELAGKVFDAAERANG